MYRCICIPWAPPSSRRSVRPAIPMTNWAAFVVPINRAGAPPLVGRRGPSDPRRQGIAGSQRCPGRDERADRSGSSQSCPEARDCQTEACVPDNVDCLKCAVRKSQSTELPSVATREWIQIVARFHLLQPSVSEFGSRRVDEFGSPKPTDPPLVLIRRHRTGPWGSTASFGLAYLPNSGTAVLTALWLCFGLGSANRVRYCRSS
jgi:hypothetical protein